MNSRNWLKKPKKLDNVKFNQIFDICPGYPNDRMSSKLVENTPGVESVIHTFTIPPGQYVGIDMDDNVCEALFTPYNENGEFIKKGVIRVYIRLALKRSKIEVYKGGSLWHEPGSSLSAIGNRRRWQDKQIVCPGDMIETTFESDEKIDPIKSHLDHRVVAGDIIIEIPKKELNNLELYTISPEFPNKCLSSEIKSNVPGHQTIIYSFYVPTGHIIYINPKDNRCNIIIELRNKKGNIIKGRIDVYSKTGLYGYLERLYSSETRIHNPKYNYSVEEKMWQNKKQINAGGELVIDVISKEKIDPKKSLIEMKVRVYKIMPDGGVM
jgi:hypothetical protein